MNGTTVVKPKTIGLRQVCGRSQCYSCYNSLTCDLFPSPKQVITATPAWIVIALEKERVYDK